jgi:cytochrome c peroxidase
MNRYRSTMTVAVVSLLLGGNLLLATGRLSADFLDGSYRRGPGREILVSPNSSGEVATYTPLGAIDRQNAFFQSLGTNGRACSTCHLASDGWSISPPHIQARFQATGGLDPLFRLNDGANSPKAGYATLEERRAACSLLLTRGLIRVGIGIPDNTEFTLAACDDPYGYASAQELSLFRRPLPSANLRFLSGVMWDGRLTFPRQPLEFNLMAQVTDATLGHAQAVHAPTADQLHQVVAFQADLFVAQAVDKDAGPLNAAGALGTPRPLWATPFYLGINDPLGLNPLGVPFNPQAFTLYRAWEKLPAIPGNKVNAARRAIGRGEVLFNTRKITITGVSGLNDELGVASIQGTCTTCHDTPNVGNHSVAAPLNIGIADASRRTPDMPLYTLENKATGQTVHTTDPGRALITGKWKDIGRFKGPVLRGLAARPPYFHDGSAATLDDAVKFYDDRFKIQLSPQEKADLVAFLRAL